MNWWRSSADEAAKPQSEAAKPSNEDAPLQFRQVKSEDMYSAVPGLPAVNTYTTTGRRGRYGAEWRCNPLQNALVDCYQTAKLSADECWMLRQQMLLCIRGGSDLQIQALADEKFEKEVLAHAEKMLKEHKARLHPQEPTKDGHH